jgi:hypothetical protein
MVPYQHTADLVLLPYERQLIDALGCTEAEYKEFVRQLQNKAYSATGRVRTGARYSNGPLVVTAAAAAPAVAPYWLEA